MKLTSLHEISEVAQERLWRAGCAIIAMNMVSIAMNMVSIAMNVVSIATNMVSFPLTL